MHTFASLSAHRACCCYLSRRVSMSDITETTNSPSTTKQPHFTKYRSIEIGCSTIRRALASGEESTCLGQRGRCLRLGEQVGGEAGLGRREAEVGRAAVGHGEQPAD